MGKGVQAMFRLTYFYFGSRELGLHSCHYVQCYPSLEAVKTTIKYSVNLTVYYQVLPLFLKFLIYATVTSTLYYIYNS